jgi:predicted RND superfamily exporter protein
MAEMLQRYGTFMGNRPYLVLGVCILIFILSDIGSSLITQEVTDFSEQIPEDLESIKAFNFVRDEFGETGSGVIFAVEIDPDYAGSDETRDVRNPDVMEYLDLLAGKARTIEQVTGATSAADLLKQANGGRLPESGRSIKEIMDMLREQSPGSMPDPFALLISRDYAIAAVRITYIATDEGKSEDIIDELLHIAEETRAPAGVKTTLTGGPVTNIALNRQIGPTFAATGMLSFVGIFTVVILLFYSLRYGITSLFAVIFGSTWAFGFAGFTGLSLTPETSGALSLILGIGIDFGIQVVTRFRQEFRKSGVEEAIANTMPSVIPPMTISTLAIVLGFKALSFGNLQFIGKLGDIMALGVVMSYLAAITVVPAVLVILNTIKLKRFGGR